MTNLLTIQALADMTKESIRLHARYKLDCHKIQWRDATHGLQISDPLSIQFEERTAEMHAHDKAMSGAYLAYCEQEGVDILTVIDAINDYGEVIAA